MNQPIHVDRQALREFIDLMRQTADDLADALDRHAPDYAGHESMPVDRWHGGVRVTLGTVDHPHLGRDAGEMMANRVGEGAHFAASMEEGTRAIGDIAEQILSALDSTDHIHAETLETITAGLPTAAIGVREV